MRVSWPMKSCEIWNKSEIILGCAEKKITDKLVNVFKVFMLYKKCILTQKSYDANF